MHSPGNFNYFGLYFNIFDDFSTEIHAYNKLQQLVELQLSQMRRMQITKRLKEIELFQFRSQSSNLSWLGTALFLICAFLSSFLQLTMPNATITDTVQQHNMLRTLKKIGTSIS